MPDRPAGTGFPRSRSTVLLGGLAVATALGAYPPPGRPSLPGLLPPTVRRGRAATSGETLVEPLGAGAWVFVAGWLAVGVSLLCRRRLTSLARAVGWAVLTGCACLIADWIGPTDTRPAHRVGRVRRGVRVRLARRPASSALGQSSS